MELTALGKKEKTRCPHCGHVTDKREIVLYKGLVVSLWKVYRWCLENKIHEFKMSDIRPFLGQVNYTRFGDWVMFGGLVYKTSKAHYGINLERCEEFFNSRLTIPTKIIKDPITNELEKLDYKTVRDIPSLKQFLDENNLYVPVYVPR